MLIPQLVGHAGLGLSVGSDFTCAKSTANGGMLMCTPANQVAALTLKALQQQINRALTAINKTSLLVGIDGVIGARTVMAVNAILDVAPSVVKPALSEMTVVILMQSLAKAANAPSPISENAEALTRYFKQVGDSAAIPSTVAAGATPASTTNTSVLVSSGGTATSGTSSVPRIVWYVAGGVAALGVLGLLVHFSRKHHAPHAMAGLRMPPRLHGYGYGRY